MRKYACAALITFFLLSCNQKKEVAPVLEAANVIDMSTAVDKSFDDLIEEITCIPLQKAEGGLDGCWKLISYKGYYYFYSLFDFSVSIYDWNGMFVKKIENKGEGKITLPTDMLINKEKEELWICESRSILQKYSLKGDFIESVQLPLSNIKMEFVDKDGILVYMDQQNRESNKLFVLLQPDNYAVLDSLVDKSKKKFKYGRISPSLFAKDQKRNQTYALLEKRNVIYKYDSDRKSLDPYISLDFKGKYLNEDLYPENDFTDKEKSEILKKNEYIHDIVGFQAQAGKLFFYTLGKEQYFYSIDLDSNALSKYQSLFDGFSPRNVNSPISGSDELYLYLVLNKKELSEYYNKPESKFRSVFDKAFSNNEPAWENAVVRVKVR